MPELIRDFKTQKVKDYLDTGLYSTVLLRFYHGLGDTVMFQPDLIALRDMYPTIDIDLEVRYGQEELWTSHKPSDKHYDAIFEIGFPMSEYSHPEYTKGEWCCIAELGITPPKALYKYSEKLKSPLVGMHFFSTCMPDKLGIKEDVAHKIRDRILNAGLIPIDTNMRHPTFNNRNKKFSWNTCAIEDAKASCKTLVGVLQRCCGFVGCVSGNFNLATAVMPAERILFLNTSFPAERLTRHPVLQLNVHQWDDKVLDKWIENISKEDKNV